MAGFLSVGVGAAGVSSWTVDVGYIVNRVANLLKRSDLDGELIHWVNFALLELAEKIDFPELRVTAGDIALVPSPATYAYSTPTDFLRPSSVYFKDTTDAANKWGRNLVPLPREFYEGDVVDFERLLNVSVPSVGSPKYYFVLYNMLYIYPALASQNTGVLQLHYYKVPPDLTAFGDVPAIDKKWRQYLIPLAYYWMVIMSEKGDMSKPGFWENKKKMLLLEVRSLVRGTENKVEVIQPPITPMERADNIY